MLAAAIEAFYKEVDIGKSVKLSSILPRRVTVS